MIDRFELYVNAEEDIVAINDKLTGKKYSTLEDIIDLLNIIINEDYYYKKILNLISTYESRAAANKGIVISGDVYNAKISVLYELIKKEKE